MAEVGLLGGRGNVPGVPVLAVHRAGGEGQGRAGLPRPLGEGQSLLLLSSPSCWLGCGLTSSRPTGPHLCSLLVPSARCTAAAGQRGQPAT